MKTKQITNRWGFTIVACLFLLTMMSGCAEGSDASGDPQGFLAGLAHGLLAVVTLIIKVFVPDIIVYSMNNSGWWYDLGFMIGVGSFAITVKN